MPAVDELLRPYVEAADLEEAAAALDELAPSDDLPAELLGDCYDDLAEAAADAEDFKLAVRLERRGVELVLVTLAHARSDAGLQDASLAAFDEAVEVAKRRGFARELDRARIERRAERDHVGLPLDEDDRLAPEPRPIVEQRVAWTLAWFAPDQRAAALERWPTLADDFADPIAYNARIEGSLRQLQHETARLPSIAPLDVHALTEWAAQQGYDPDTGSARSLFAAELARRGQALAWPPGRNDPCWCRSGRKYKRCCGKA